MKTILFVLLFTLSSCVSLRTVSLTQIPKKRSKKVSTQVEKWVFLAFNFDNDFVDDVAPKLADKCDNGQVKGILTKYEVANYVLFFKYTIRAKGFCV